VRRGGLSNRVDNPHGAIPLYRVSSYAVLSFYAVGSTLRAPFQCPTFSSTSSRFLCPSWFFSRVDRFLKNAKIAYAGILKRCSALLQTNLIPRLSKILISTICASAIYNDKLGKQHDFFQFFIQIFQQV
jgi:hypothetical protein